MEAKFLLLGLFIFAFTGADVFVNNDEDPFPDSSWISDRRSLFKREDDTKTSDTTITEENESTTTEDEESTTSSSRPVVQRRDKDPMCGIVKDMSLSAMKKRCYLPDNVLGEPGAKFDLSLSTDEDVKGLLSDVKKIHVPVILRNSTVTTLPVSLLETITEGLTVSDNLNLRTMTTGSVKHIEGNELIIENNPKLESIELNLKKVSLNNGLFIKNNPNITSLNLGVQYNAPSDFSVKGEGVQIFNNRKLKFIYLGVGFKKKVDGSINVLISGNPSLDKDHLENIGELFKDVSNNSKYIQEEGECVFLEPLELLEDLRICKYVLGDLVISPHTDNFTTPTPSFQLAEVKNGSIVINGTNLDDLSIFNGTKADGLVMENNELLCNLTADDAKEIFNITDDTKFIFFNSSCPTTTTMTTTIVTTTTVTTKKTTPSSTKLPLVPSGEIPEEPENQASADGAPPAKTKEDLEEERRKKQGIVSHVFGGLFFFLVGALCSGGWFVYKQIKIYDLELDVIAWCIEEYKRQVHVECAEKVYEKFVEDWHRSHPEKVPSEVLWPVTAITCEPNFEFEGEYPYAEEAAEITDKMMERDMDEMREVHEEIMRKVQQDPFTWDPNDHPKLYDADPCDRRNITRWAFLEDKRVRLDFEKFCLEDDYYNASYMGYEDNPKRFIAAQAPRLHTDHAFWSMVLQHDCRAVVQIGNMYDVETEVPHNFQYYPFEKGACRTVQTALGCEITIETLDVQWMPPEYEGPMSEDIKFYQYKRQPGKRKPEKKGRVETECKAPKVPKVKKSYHAIKYHGVPQKEQIFEEWPYYPADPMDPFDEDSTRQMVRLRKLRLMCPSLKIDREIIHFQWMNWAPGGYRPSIVHLHRVIHLLNKIPGTIVAHSYFGYDRAPFLAVTTLYFDRMRRGERLEDPLEFVEKFAKQRFGVFNRFWNFLHFLIFFNDYVRSIYYDRFEECYNFDEEDGEDGLKEFNVYKGDLEWEAQKETDVHI